MKMLRMIDGIAMPRSRPMRMNRAFSTISLNESVSFAAVVAGGH